MDGEVIWALPINENKEYIASNVKYHCYDDGKSLCGKYTRHGSSETEIESGEILSNPQLACKCCYGKWKKIFHL